MNAASVAIASILAALLAGCATAPELATPAGYPRLSVAADEENLLVFSKPGFDVSRYPRIMVEPVRVMAKGLREAEVTTAEARKIAQYAQKTFASELGKKFEIATRPAPDVLRIRFTITDLQPTGAAQAIMLMPPFAMVNMISSKGAFTGSITFGGEFFEGNSNAASVAFLAYRSRPGVDATVAFGRWDAVHKVIDIAAERLARDLDNASRRD